ncbi:siderophore-interacting protein [Phyllobacterium sp. SB3]|uniref:siderophore-interacting protein n=1 Tax=Phyllobacterium sp. SB3 TaxID=3156073 RepID=UPI0032AF6774
MTAGVARTGFAAHANFSLSNYDAVIGPMCEHMVEHGAAVETQAGGHIIHMGDSVTQLRPKGDMTFVDITAKSLEDLYYVRSAIASHVLEFATESVDIKWEGDGNDFVRPPNFHIFKVENVFDLTPRMRRIRFSTDAAKRFVPLTALHLNLLVQHPELTSPQWPTLGTNGLIQWTDPDRRPSFRKYTVRDVDVDAGTLDIDFVLHTDAGPGSHFARNARRGMEIGVTGPGGGGLVPADWYLFAGDETALPAIARMLRYLPENARGIAIIEVADERETQNLSTDTKIEIKWLYRNSRTGSYGSLADAVRQISLPGDQIVYVWTGCEFEDFRSIRTFLKQEISFQNLKHLIVSYWRRGSPEALN